MDRNNFSLKLRHFHSYHTLISPLKGVTAQCDWNRKAISESLIPGETEKAITLTNVHVENYYAKERRHDRVKGHYISAVLRTLTHSF